MKKKSIWNEGHYFQLVWIIIGSSLQIWIGGLKGLIVMMIGIILFLINGIIISRREYRFNILKIKYDYLKRRKK